MQINKPPRNRLFYLRALAAGLIAVVTIGLQFSPIGLSSARAAGLPPSGTMQNIPDSGECADGTGRWVKFTTGGSDDTGELQVNGANSGSPAGDADYSYKKVGVDDGEFFVKNINIPEESGNLLFAGVVGKAGPTTEVWNFSPATASPILSISSDKNFSQFALCVVDKARIVLIKQVVGGPASPGSWTLSWGATSAATGTMTVVDPGTANLTESGGPSGYSFTSLVCTNSTTAGTVVSGISKTSTGLTLAAGDLVTCTFTNTKATTFTVTKNLVGGVGPATFGFSLVCTNPVFNAGPISLNVAAGQTSGNASFTGVPTGAACTVSETQTDAAYLGATGTQSVASVTSDNSVSFSNTKKKAVVDLVKSVDKTSVQSGDSVNYTITVKNLGNYPLPKADVVVSDNKCTLVGPTGDVGADSVLSINETWTYTCSKVLTDDTINIATVTYPGGKDEDSKTVNVVKPGIQITKAASSPKVQVGDAVTYTYRVNNTGDGALSSVGVTDDKCSPVTYVSGDTNNDSKLDLAETWLFTCNTSLVDAMINVAPNAVLNTATASGTDSLGKVSTAKATALVVIIHPLFAITKTPSATSVLTGTSVTYTYRVSNSGDVALSNIVVTDDKCSPLSGVAGDTNNDNQLDLAEVWTYTCTQALNLTTTNIATVNGVDPLEKSLTPKTATVTVTVSAPTTTTTTTAVATTSTTAVPTTTTTAVPTTSTTVAAQALVFLPIPTTPSTTIAPAVAPAAAPIATSTAPPVTVPAAVLAASVATTSPPNVLGVQVSQTEPAFTGPSSTTNSAGLLGLSALLAGLALVGGQRILRTRRRTR